MTHNSYFIGLKMLCIFSVGCIGSALMYLPLFYREVLGFGNARIGFITAIIPFTSTIAFPYWASVVDRTGAFKKVMMRNMLVALVSTLSIGAVPYLFQSALLQTVLIAFCCFGYSFFGYSVISLVDAVILRVLADQKTLFGKQKIGMPIGFALSSFTTGLLIGKLGSPYALFIVYAMSNLLFVATVAFTSIEPYNYEAINDMDDDVTTLLPPVSIKYSNDRSELSYNNVTVVDDEDELSTVAAGSTMTTSKMDDEASTIWNLLESPDAIQFFTYITLMGFSMSIILAFLFLFFEHNLHASPTLIGLLGPLGSSTELLCFFFSREIFTRLGGSSMLLIAQCILIIRSSVYVFCPEFPLGVYLAVVIQLLHGLGFSMTMTASALQADHLAPPHLKSSVQGLLNMCFNGLGSGFGALFGGLVYEHFGASAMWVLNATIAIFSIAVYTSTFLRGLIFVPLARAIESHLANRNK